MCCIQCWICTKTWWAKLSSSSNLRLKASPPILRSSLNLIRFRFLLLNFCLTAQVSRGCWVCLASRSYRQEPSKSINKPGRLWNWPNLVDLTRPHSAFCQANFRCNPLRTHLIAQQPSTSSMKMNTTLRPFQSTLATLSTTPTSPSISPKHSFNIKSHPQILVTIRTIHLLNPYK